MTEYSIFPIPYPPSEAHITCYITIRLHGLQTDPQAFGSTYVRELNFTRDQWRARLDSSDKITFVACGKKHFHNPKEGPGDDWVATVTVLNPNMLQAARFGGYEHLNTRDEAVYMLVGMWVHPEHRCQGLGRRLVTAAIEFVHTTKDAARKNLLMLEVHNRNMQAKRLYESMGFVNGGPAGDDGEIWMVHRLNDDEVQIPSPNKTLFGNLIHT